MQLDVDVGKHKGNNRCRLPVVQNMWALLPTDVLATINSFLAEEVKDDLQESRQMRWVCAGVCKAWRAALLPLLLGDRSNMNRQTADASSHETEPPRPTNSALVAPRDNSSLHHLFTHPIHMLLTQRVSTHDPANTLHASTSQTSKELLRCIVVRHKSSAGNNSFSLYGNPDNGPLSTPKCFMLHAVQTSRIRPAYSISLSHSQPSQTAIATLKAERYSRTRYSLTTLDASRQTWLQGWLAAAGLLMPNKPPGRVRLSHMEPTQFSYGSGLPRRLDARCLQSSTLRNSAEVVSKALMYRSRHTSSNLATTSAPVYGSPTCKPTHLLSRLSTRGSRRHGRGSMSKPNSRTKTRMTGTGLSPFAQPLPMTSNQQPVRSTGIAMHGAGTRYNVRETQTSGITTLPPSRQPVSRLHRTARVLTSSGGSVAVVFPSCLKCYRVDRQQPTTIHSNEHACGFAKSWFSSLCRTLKQGLKAAISCSASSCNPRSPDLSFSMGTVQSAGVGTNYIMAVQNPLFAVPVPDIQPRGQEHAAVGAVAVEQNNDEGQEDIRELGLVHGHFLHVLHEANESGSNHSVNISGSSSTSEATVIDSDPDAVSNDLSSSRSSNSSSSTNTRVSSSMERSNVGTNLEIEELGPSIDTPEVISCGNTSSMFQDDGDLAVLLQARRNSASRFGTIGQSSNQAGTSSAFQQVGAPSNTCLTFGDDQGPYLDSCGVPQRIEADNQRDNTLDSTAPSLVAQSSPVSTSKTQKQHSTPTTVDVCPSPPSETVRGPPPRLVKFSSKPPHWNNNLRCWCLNFGGRVRLPSARNFQLCAPEGPGSAHDPQRVILQFGKIGTDVFCLDWDLSLLSPVQALAAALTAFHRSL